MTDDQWRNSFEALEQQVTDNYADGITNYPPTCAEFLGLCKIKKKDFAFGGAYKIYLPGLPVPLAEKEKRKETGIETCRNILDILG